MTKCRREPVEGLGGKVPFLQVSGSPLFFDSINPTDFHSPGGLYATPTLTKPPNSKKRFDSADPSVKAPLSLQLSRRFMMGILTNSTPSSFKSFS
jgi:hypothetical protein